MSEENKIVYRNIDGLNVSDWIEKGKTQLFDTREEAYDYATQKRSYFYQINVSRKGELIGYAFGVPR